MKTAIQAFSALGNPVRLSAFRLLMRAGPLGLSRLEIAATLRATASAMTLHLHKLHEAGLIEVEPESRRVGCAYMGKPGAAICRVRPKALAELFASLLGQSGQEAAIQELLAILQPRDATAETVTLERPKRGLR